MRMPAADLPILPTVAPRQRPGSTLQRLLVQSFRIGLFVIVVVLIHQQRVRREASAKEHRGRLTEATVRAEFPMAQEIVARDDAWLVQRSEKESLRVFQTSPLCDGIIGFSGPTNVLVAVDDHQRIERVKILSSQDTRDHVQHVIEDAKFLPSFVDVSTAEIPTAIDAVSGATLTSLAIRESVVMRLTGLPPGSRFDSQSSGSPRLSVIQKLFPAATGLHADKLSHTAWVVQNGDVKIGEVLRTSPTADSIVGYQGPTDCLIGLNSGDQVIGILMRDSFDNEPYTDYVRDDAWFARSFNDYSLNDLATGDAMSFQVEGVSGATMTSLAVADGIFAAARARLQERKRQQTAAAQQKRRRPWVDWTVRDAGTGLVVLAGILFGFTRLRGKRTGRFVFQVIVIGYLGLMNGDMVSQALLAGWAQNGIPWRTASGLVLLTTVAFLAPMTTKTNLYCAHLCPHGALQQLIRNRLPWRVRLTRRLRTGLKLVPWLLLLWVVIVAMSGMAMSLVDIEPFDAWLPTIAGRATIGVAMAGLVAALFVPLAYCRYGCPTGALLNFFRLNRHTHRLGRADVAALACVGVAYFLMQ